MKVHQCEHHQTGKCEKLCRHPGICQMARPDQAAGNSKSEGMLGPNGEKGWKLKCTSTHAADLAGDDGHFCGAKEHTCRTQCPLCGYFCRLKYNHLGKMHAIDHGPVNVTRVHLDQLILSGDAEALEMNEEMTCSELCRKAGRGHFHAKPCQTAGCQFEAGKKVHLADKSKDLYNHAAYFEELRINDPCSPLEQERYLFSHCGKRCHSEHCGDIYCDEEQVPHHSSAESGGSKTLNGHRFSQCTQVCQEKCHDCRNAHPYGPYGCKLLVGHEPSSPHSCLQHCNERCQMCQAKML